MNHLPLIFVRHGETEWNRGGRLQGHRDIPLNAMGRRQAARNGRALASLLGNADWDFWASPLDRASETMRIALGEAGRPDQPFRTDDRLREITYGDWEGMTLPHLFEHEPERVQHRDQEKWLFQHPGGESYSMLSDRVAAWLDELTGPTVVAAHGGIMRVLLHLIGGMSTEAVPFLYAPQDRILLFTERQVATI